MRLLTARHFLIVSLLLSGLGAAAQNNFFSDAPEASFKTGVQKRQIIPNKYRTVVLDTTSMLSLMRIVPSEKNTSNRALAPVVQIPMPDGSTAKFNIWESTVMAPELAALYPHIKTFTGQGIDDRTATIKIEWTDFGFHAMISSSLNGAVFIDPYDIATHRNYIVYNKADYKKAAKFLELEPRRRAGSKKASKPSVDGVQAGSCVGTVLRTYRLAVACTHEYAQAATGLISPTKAQVLSKITTTVNRVNSVYEKELSVRLTLVAGENNIIFNTEAVDQFTQSTVGQEDGANFDALILIDESQQVIDNIIGSTAYDIGHTFSTGAGGLAQLGVVCIDGYKAQGVTGSPVPFNDPYDIDYVAHEIGHQFGAEHTFNSALGSCDGNQSGISNVEPGSGSTIMAYAGICDADDLQTNSDPQFHAISFDQITDYYLFSYGSDCGVATNTGNAIPVVNAGNSYTIPKSTPFVLTGTATDANAGDVLTYSWEQIDGGGPYDTWDNPSGNAPLFRSFAPVATGVRHFPRITDQANNTSTIGEVLPDYARTMNFRLTARDNRAGGAGICYGQVTVATASTAGPFVLTYPSASGIVWTVNDFQTITWNVAGTNQGPVNCTAVDIQLSIDGGLTYPINLATNTANDGTEEIQVPNNVSAQARVRVISRNNIFYDYSDQKFSIQAAASPSFSFNSPAPVYICGAASAPITLKTAALGTFTTAINLSATLNPGGTTVSFGTNPVTPGGNTIITLNNTASLAAGTYTIRVSGTAGAVTKTRDIVFIAGSSNAAPALLAPVNDAIGVATQPACNWAAVSNATSYVIELSKTATFSTLDTSISNISAPPFILTKVLDENTIYYWRVKAVSACGAGAASAANRFKTGYSTCRNSTDVPKDISASGTPTVTSVINVPAALGVVITDINVVNLTGTHSYTNDLRITLIGPDNTSVVLLNRICDGTANFNVNVDDAGAVSPNCPATEGQTIKPATPLSVFNGKNSTGVWTLRVEDIFDADGGKLNSWGLSINTGSTNCNFVSSPLLSTYTFTGNGNWNTASNWSNNTIPPSPLPDGSSIIINHTAGGQCLLNVNQVVQNGASVIVNAGKNLVIQGALTVQQ